MQTVAKLTLLPLFEKKKKCSGRYFIHSDIGYAKSDKYRENEAKTMRNGDEIWRKK